MRCSEVRDCLPLFAGGDLDPQSNSRVADHLRACATCRNEQHELTFLRDLAPAALARAVPESVMASFSVRLSAALASEAQRLAAPVPGSGMRVFRAVRMVLRPGRYYWRPAAVALLLSVAAAVRLGTYSPTSAPRTRQPDLATRAAVGTAEETPEDAVVVYRPDDEGTIIVWVFEGKPGADDVFRGR
ncbi:MAG: zf-HC2 domain-containing protein [Candidatus Schekmanbacteria bacterium]|nr:zf-HC2 domain-containing protein [Candidatus Schekmanbacteria bacterium]